MKTNNKGISMITLAITILVMIILAGVIVMTLADGGIIDRASNTVTGYNDREQQESDIVSNIESEIEKELGNTSSSGNTGDNTGSDSGTGGDNTGTDTGNTTPQPQILKDVITSSNYGDTVQYSANGITDWKVFYNDGTNVFIIAADYMSNTCLPENALMGTHTDYPKSAYWPSGSVYLDNVTGAADIDTTIASKYMLGWLTQYPTSTNQNIKAVATMMDQEVWNVFADSTYADSAIATPTFEMFAKSWNQKYSAGAQVYCDLTSDIGYYVTTTAPADRTDTITTTYVSLSGETGYADTLYFPHQETTENCNGYWLAAPSTYVYNEYQCPQYIYCSGMIGANQGGCCGSSNQETATADFSLRPVVCLNTAIKGLKTDTGWTLSE